MTLNEAIKRYTDNAEYERTHGNLQGCLEFRQLAEYLKELKQLREQTKWIPISERLPNKKEEVLATTEWGEITIAERYIENEWIIQEGYNNADDDDIIAWMPLPEPYKAESE